MERRSFVSGLLGFLGLSAVAVKGKASSEPLEKYQDSVKSLETSLATGNIEREKHEGELLECKRKFVQFGKRLTLDPGDVIAVHQRPYDDNDDGQHMSVVYLSSGQSIDTTDQIAGEILACCADKISDPSEFSS